MPDEDVTGGFADIANLCSRSRYCPSQRKTFPIYFLSTHEIHNKVKSDIFGRNSLRRPLFLTLSWCSASLASRRAREIPDEDVTGGYVTSGNSGCRGSPGYHKESEVQMVKVIFSTGASSLQLKSIVASVARSSNSSPTNCFAP